LFLFSSNTVHKNKSNVTSAQTYKQNNHALIFAMFYNGAQRPRPNRAVHKLVKWRSQQMVQ